MQFRTSFMVIVLATLVASTLSQYNEVEDYGDYGGPAPRGGGNSAPPAPRSYAPSRGHQVQLPSTASGPRATPVPILKQINRHNEDGSYTYGYEGADGSFKIETKLNSGEVVGKYGYVDDLGKVRVVEYGANKFGFQPSGEGITVAPPTLVDETAKQKGGSSFYDDDAQQDDGQYYEAPRPVHRPPQRAQSSGLRPRPLAPAPPPPSAPVQSPAPASAPAHSPRYETYERTIEFAPPRSSSSGPTPPRAQVPGAAPSGFSSAPRAAPSSSGFSNAPPRLGPSPSFSNSPRLGPSPSLFEPSARPAPRPSLGGGRSGGILDQLAKDYALPSNAAPALSDISFGYY